MAVNMRGASLSRSLLALASQRISAQTFEYQRDLIGRGSLIMLVLAFDKSGPPWVDLLLFVFFVKSGVSAWRRREIFAGFRFFLTFSYRDYGRLPQKRVEPRMETGDPNR
ncbi:MAG: hypothetical protein ACREEM_14055 [Blastocatellia bacterium]